MVLKKLPDHFKDSDLAKPCIVSGACDALSASSEAAQIMCKIRAMNCENNSASNGKNAFYPTTGKMMCWKNYKG